jgi:hypothetical protein
MTVNAYWEAKRLGFRSGKVVGLNSAPGLLICALSDCVVGFHAPEHSVAFLFSAANDHLHGLHGLSASGDLLAISVLIDECTELPRSIVAFTSGGAALSWDFDVTDQNDSFGDTINCSLGHGSGHVVAKECCQLVAAYNGGLDSSAISRHDNLYWIADVAPGVSDIRWISHLSNRFHIVQGSVRTAVDPLRSAALLPAANSIFERLARSPS